MFNGYDTQSAEKRLESLALDRYNSAHSGTQLSRVFSASAHYEAVPVGNTWSLVHRNTNEELVVSLQGILLRKDLPPFVDKIGRNSYQVRYLRQSVSVAGYTTSTFAKVVDAITGIHALLSRAVGMDNVSECGMLGCVNDTQVLEMSNRYFKPRHAGSDVEGILLSADIDPYGYLTKASAAAGLYHSEDNVVQYFEREGSSDETYKYTPVKPSHFAAGDIVEVQASFVLFPIKDGKYKSGMILRGITYLDGTFTQAMVKNMVASRIPNLGQTVSMKRKVGYGEEELSVARAKMVRMDIDYRSNINDTAGISTDGQSSNDQTKVGELGAGVFAAGSSAISLD